MTRVSVALATYQGARYLPQQLNSMAAQDQPPFELVVCDDGSTDSTRAILDDFATHATFPVRRSDHPANRGTLDAFQTALEGCSGEIIVLSDQDDVWKPTRLRLLTEALDAHPAATLAVSDADLLTSRLTHRGRYASAAGLTRTRRRRLETHPFGFVLARPAVAGCMIAIRRADLDLLLPFPRFSADGFGPLYHDHWISLALAAIGPFALIREPLLSYRLHEDQQVGIPWHPWRRLIPVPVWQWRQLLIPRAEHDRRLGVYHAYLSELLARIATRPNSPRLREARHTLTDALRHIDERRSLPARQLPRARRVAHEWKRHGYRTYALGASTAAADLLRR